MNMNYWLNRTVRISFVIAAVLCVTINSNAQTVELSFPDITGVPGEVLDIPILINNAEGVFGSRIELLLPNNTEDYPLEFISIRQDNTLSTDWSDLSFDAGNIIDRTMEEAGTLRFVTNGVFPINVPSGTLFRLFVRIKATAFGQTVPLDFTDETTVNDTPDIVKVNGSVTVDAPLQTPTSTPTITPTGTATPTPTLSPTHTPTLDPAVTPPTETPRPSNQAPSIVIEPQERFLVKVGEPLDILVVANDADGDLLNVFLSLNAPATLKSSVDLPTGKLVEYSLDTSRVGDISFIVLVDDGQAQSSKEVFVSVVSSLTPTPSRTPVPKDVIVSDNLFDFSDLSGGTDFDDVNDRKLTIRWNVPSLNATDWHVYVQSGFGSRAFLGATGGGDIRTLTWEPNSSVISDNFINGPEFGNIYSFTIIRIDESITPDDFFKTSAPVGFNNTGGGVVTLPNTRVAVSDNELTTADLSGQTDFDDPEDRKLTIRWLADPNGATNWHIYVRRGFGEFKFLGQTGTGFADHYSWFPNAPQLNPEFADGPQFNSVYQFEVIRIDGSLGEVDFYTQTVPVGFTFNGGEALEIPENTVKVVDDFNSERDLTGRTDFDNSDERNLTIKWALPAGDATDWHIYVREGLGGRKFLGRTGNGTVQFFNWFPNSPNTISEFQSGPEFNKTYNFRVIRVDSSFDRDDVFDQPFPVGFNQSGTANVKLSVPEQPNLNGRRVAIYDDILASDDLAPIGNIGEDTDSPDRRFIHIAWNFNSDQSTIYDHHIQVSVNGGGFQFLGQTQDNKQQYFWWTPDNLFRTATQFANGPQDGNEYQFRITRRNPNSSRDILTSGVLTYNVQSGIITPTSTPQPNVPTFTPTATPTQTLTPTPTFTQTPTATPFPLAYTFRQIDNDTLELTLPGVVNEVKPLQFKIIRLGEFDMGSPESERGRKSDETLRANVRIPQNYYIGKYEITQAQWRSVMGSNPAWFNDHFNKPVESVSWNDVQLFLNAINNQVNQGLFRLPTEAEWEYAARSRTQTRFSFGNGSECSDTGMEFCSTLDRFMWWLGNNTFGTNRYGTKQVGLKQANAFGLNDMHGNVAEWCQDWYGPYNGNVRINPTGPVTGTRRVVRGGAWSKDAAGCRSASRNSLLPTGQYVTVGFRVVFQVESPSQVVQ